VVDELFPGLNPRLPETFQEIGLEVAPPDAPAPKAAKGHGPQMATRTDDERVVRYEREPKEQAAVGKTPATPAAPKRVRAAQKPKTPKPGSETGDGGEKSEK
jgi:hypothetical protein